MTDLGYRILNKLIEWKIPILGYPLRRNDLVLRPFFIVGSGRSGNTLLRRILFGHSELYIPPETYVLGHAIKTFREHNRINWRHLVFLILSIFEYHPEFTTFECTLGPLAQELARSPASSRNLAYLLDRFYRYHADLKGFKPSRWGDKTPLNIYALAPIRRVFPRAQFIHIIRDGCDVVDSYLRSGIYPDLTSAAKRWTSSVRAFSKFSRRFPEACCQIRYEDLVTKPQETIAELCGFLGVAFEEQMINSEDLSHLMGDVGIHSHHKRVGSKITPLRIGKGRQTLTAEEKQILGAYLDDDLIKFGYDPCVQE